MERRSKDATSPQKIGAGAFDYTWLLPFVLIGAGCLHAVIQEQLMQDLGHGFPLLVTSFEFGCCSCLSLLTLKVQGANPLNVPLKSLLQISVLVLSSLVSGNVALRWVSYPVKVVVKSCKLLPTMALGSLLLGKRYSRHDGLAALLLCGALVGFALSDPGAAGKGRASSPVGVGVLLFAVSCDSVQVLLSEKMLRGAPHLTPNHVMLYTNGFAFLGVLLGLIASGELSSLPSCSLQLDSTPDPPHPRPTTLIHRIGCLPLRGCCLHQTKHRTRDSHACRVGAPQYDALGPRYLHACPVRRLQLGECQLLHRPHAIVGRHSRGAPRRGPPR